MRIGGGIGSCTDMQPRDRNELALVTVLTAHDSMALSLAKASLDEAGIAYLVSGEDPEFLPGIQGGAGIGTTPLWHCSSRIEVAAEFAAEARVVLRDLTSAEAIREEAQEPDSGIGT